MSAAGFATKESIGRAAVPLDSFLSVLPTLPFDRADMRALFCMAETGRNRGLRTALLPRTVTSALSPRAEMALFKETIEGFLKDGLAFVSSPRWPLDVAIIKSDAGRGLFGRRKACFHVLVSEAAPGESYEPGPVRSSVLAAGTDAIAFFDGLAKAEATCPRTYG